jgi:glycosyltransferase involved in cell wall biosynthesis
MTDRRLVTFVFKHAPGQVYGGERSAVLMLSHLRRVRPTVVLNVEDEAAEMFRAAGVPVVILPLVDVFTGFRTLPARQRFARARTWLGYNVRARALLRELEPDVIHCNDIPEYRALAPALVTSRVPVLLQSRCEVSLRPSHQLAMALATRVVVVSDGLRDRYAERVSPLVRRRIVKRLSVAHNGVAFGAVEAYVAAHDREEVRRSLGMPPDEVALLLVGSLEPRKAQLEFIEQVLPRALAAVPRLRLYLVGGRKGRDHAYEAACHSAALRLGLVPHVSFVGYEADVYRWYVAADAVVLPSLAEGLPRSILEALAVGRPVIGMRIPGMSDLVRDGENGYSVAVADHVAFAEAVIALAREPALRDRLGQAGRRLAARKFDVRDTAARFERLVEELIDEGAPGFSPGGQAS